MCIIHTHLLLLLKWWLQHRLQLDGESMERRAIHTGFCKLVVSNELSDELNQQYNRHGFLSGGGGGTWTVFL